MIYAEVCTIDPRQFVKDVLELGRLGGKLLDDCAAFRAPMMRAKVAMFDVNVKDTPTIRVTGTPEVAKTEVTESVKIVQDKKYTRDELDAMSLAEVRKATGIQSGGKQAIIDEYLGA